MRAFTAHVGPHLPRALRRRGSQAAPLPLRRPGQLARPDRGAAREQRAAHRPRDARGDPVEGRPGPRHPAAGVERGARAAPPVGPAVVAAHPAGAGLRDRPARVRRHLRGLQGHRGQDGRAGRGGHRRARRRAGARRRVRGHRRAEAPAGAQPGRAGAPHRDRRARRSSASTASPRRRRRRSSATARSRPSCGSTPRRGRADRRRRALAGRPRRRRGAAPPSTSCGGWPRTTARGNIMPATIALAHAGGTTGEWAGALREVFGEYRAPTGVGGGVGSPRRRLAPIRVRTRRWPSAPAARRACWWPSPGSTATPTAPSRSPWRPATPASRSSTRASG